jgi:hypothetical protein
MPPEARRPGFDDLLDSGMDMPFDADLESLDLELAAAGAQARRMLFGRSQPTRVFSNQLRGRLLETFEPRDTGSVLGELAIQGGAAREIQVRPSDLISSDTVAAASNRDEPIQADPATLRTVLALLAIAGMAVLLAMGALGGSFGSPLP